MQLSKVDYIILLMVAITIVIGSVDLYSKHINTYEPMLEGIDHMETPEYYEKIA